MKRLLFPPLAGAVALVLTAGTVLAQQSGGPAAMEGAQRWAADHEALLDAKLAGLKAGLRLNQDQEKLWGPFEAAVRDAAKLRMQHMAKRMERMRAMEHMDENSGDDESSARPSPIDRLDALALRMAEGAAAIKNVADAARPLYASLDENQKRIFGWLGRELIMMGHRHHGVDGGMGMMGPDHMGPNDMEMMRGHGAIGGGMMGRHEPPDGDMGSHSDEESDGSDNE